MKDAIATIKDATDRLRNLNLHCHHLRANFPADYDKRHASLARLTTECCFESPYVLSNTCRNKHSIFTALPWQQKHSMVFVDTAQFAPA